MPDNNELSLSEKYRRRYPLRRIMQWIARAALNIVADVRIEGRENFPKEGPLLMVGNHFSFIDPVVFVGITPWPVDFVGGANFPNAPKIVRWIPRLWGYLPLYRGTGATTALREAEKVLKRGGVLGIFPEGGSWATVLRPARPGAAYLTTRTSARLLPVGLDGLPEVFPTLRRFRRARVTIRIGKPFGPFSVNGRGRERRQKMDEIGDKIMERIAALLPPESRGFYSDDPEIREAAKGTEKYPWEDAVEGEVKGIY